MGYGGTKHGSKWFKGDYHLYGFPHVICDSYFLKLVTGDGTSAETAAGNQPGPVRKKVRIAIDGVDYYFLACNDWVNPNSSSNSPSRSPSASLSPSASRSSSPSPSHV
jgi:hypothetical protein